jgi:O-antigen/teichoic acid export membrane protein
MKFLHKTNLFEIVKGAFAALSIKIGAAILTYLISYIIIKHYGSEIFGVYSFFFTGLYFLAVFSGFGINTTVLKYVSRFGETENAISIKEFYKKILLIVIPISLFCSILVFANIDFIKTKLIKFPESNQVIILFGLLIPAVVLTSINADIFRGFRKIVISESIRMLISPVITLVLIVVIGLFFEYKTIPLYYYFSSVFFVFVLSSGLLFVKIQYEKSDASSLTLQEIIRVSLPIYLSSILAIILDRADFFAISYFLTIRDVAYYDIALKLSGVITYILYAVNSISAPKFSQLSSSGDHVELQKIVTFSTKLMFYATLPLFSILFLFAPKILTLFNPEFSVAAAAFRILLIGQLINVCSGSVGYLLNMSGHERIFRNIIACTTALNVLMNLLLVPKYGITGGAFSAAFSIIMWNLLCVYYVRKKLNIISYYIPFFSYEKKTT